MAGEGREDAKSTKETPQRSPEEIVAEIETSREELGDTVAELADKADVKNQAKRKATETKAKATAKKQEVMKKAAAQKETVARKAKEAAPASAHDAAQQATQGAQQAASQAKQVAQENPIPAAAIGAFVGGLAIGWMLGRR
jgi:ElaB/YqjD/DUF883 family membrane-anchored ribosome-binding protein